MKRILAGILLATILSQAYLSVTGATPVSYLASSAPATQAQAGVSAVGGGGASATSLPTTIGTIINVLLFIVGIIAVVAIIFGGIQYILSAGDQSKVTKAKDTILYAVVGLVVALLAYAIVTFVTSKL